MKITLEWLQKNNACAEGTNWFKAQAETDTVAVVKALVKAAQFSWGLWTITRVFTHKQNVLLACYSAEQALVNFEKEFPNDKRPRLAITAAKAWAKDPTEANKSVAESAAWSAAESAAWSAESAARSAAWSAESAARSAESAESAAWSAESAAWSAAESAARSAAESAAYKKIFARAVRLLRKD